VFIMKISAEAEELIAQLEVNYPRAAKNIRIFWSPDPDCREFLKSMLTHTSGKNPEGFSLAAITLISKILEVYEKQLEEVLNINKSKDEIKIKEEDKTNIWNKPEFKNR